MIDHTLKYFSTLNERRWNMREECVLISRDMEWQMSSLYITDKNGESGKSDEEN